MEKTLRTLGIGLVLAAPYAQAQTLDPAFHRPVLYTSGTVYSALEQADGKLVATGSFSRLNGAPSASLVRFNADGTLDAGFQQNVGATTPLYRVAQLGNGKLLVVAFTSTVPITAGGLTRNSLLRLNADGTGDASFDPGTGTTAAGAGAAVDFVLPLPNGQVLAAGAFRSFNGTPANNLVRLTSTGAVDPLFNPGTGTDYGIDEVALLPNGQYLVAGYFTTYNGVARPGLARVNADGSLDPTFQTPFMAGSEAINVAVQPDGRILATGYLDLGGSTLQSLVRLNANGSLDNSFSPQPSSTPIYSYYGRGIELQPDGKILVATPGLSTGQRVLRLNADGTPDPSFAAPAAAQRFALFSITRRASGQLLLAGRGRSQGTLPNNGLLQLNPDGSLDGSFMPLFLNNGSVSNVARQADGKLLISGSFTEVDGQLISNLARLNPDGTLDGGYVGAVSLLDQPTDMALQPDGRLLLAYARTVQRLLPTGLNDNSFANATLQFSTSQNTRLALQADGRVLVAGSALSAGPAIVRLLANGTGDASFAAAFGVGTPRLSSVSALALQPNGQAVVAGTFAPGSGSNTTVVRRLTLTGAFDNTFAGPTLQFSTLPAAVSSLALQPDGKVVVGGMFTAPAANLLRLLPDGSVDAGFAGPAFAGGSVSKVVVQPNGRLLLGGNFGAGALPANLARLLPNGSADASFAATAPNGTVRELLVQPDGALVAGGSFSTIGGQPANGLARLLAPNVLAVAAPAAVAAATQAWPVPAHEQLSVLPDPTAHPQALELMDLLGRVVRWQAVQPGAGATTLHCNDLPAGTYLLRVRYAEGTVSRRIQVQ